MSSRIENIDKQLTVLKGLVHRFLAGSQHDFDNIAHDIWLYAWERGLPFTTQMVKWRVADYLGYYNHRGGLHAPLHKVTGEDAGEPNTTIEDRSSVMNPSIAEIDTEDLLRHFVSRISGKRLRKVVYWRCKGFSAKQIAEVIGGNPSSINSLFILSKSYVQGILATEAGITYRPSHAKIAKNNNVLKKMQYGRRYAFDPELRKRMNLQRITRERLLAGAA